MLVIGLTGGIGSGKTTAANLFAKLGVPVIDADVIARQLTEAPLVLQQLRQHFGSSLLKADNSLDREKLRQLIFTNPLEKKWLETFLHPLINQEIQQQLQTLEASYCIVVIPLLLETGPYPYINRILVIESPEEARLERARVRDQVSREDIQRIIKTQASSTTRLASKNDLIMNDADLDSLETEINLLHKSYLTLSRTIP